MPQDKPAKISLNLDTLEREGKREPFAVVLDGKPYELADPQEMDWQSVIDIMANPMAFLSAAVAHLGEDKAMTFVAAMNHQPAWKVNKLAEQYGKHYALPSAPEAVASHTS